MLIHGLPEKFWVVTKPSPVSGLEDILFPCDFGRLMLQVRGGLQEDEIVGIFADEDEARLAADGTARRTSRPSAGRAVRRGRRQRHGQAERRGDDRQELANAAVEAVRNAVRHGEEAGFRHGLQGQVALGRRRWSCGTRSWP